LLPFGLIAAIVGILGYLSLKSAPRPAGPSPATACGAHRRGYRRGPSCGASWRNFAAKDDPQIIKETT